MGVIGSTLLSPESHVGDVKINVIRTPHQRRLWALAVGLIVEQHFFRCYQSSKRTISGYFTAMAPKSTTISCQHRHAEVGGPQNLRIYAVGDAHLRRAPLHGAFENLRRTAHMFCLQRIN